MRKRIKYEEFEKEIEQERIAEEDFFNKQLEHNSKITGFELESINTLILEKLTRLVCCNKTNERYSNEIPTDILHENIQDLCILYQIREKLQGSYKS